VLIDRAQDLANVRRSTGYVPTQILGRLSWGSLSASDDLAVAVNGTVAATTKAYVSRGATEFSTMIDEQALRDGANDVDVFAVRGTGAGTRVALLGGTDDTTRLVASSGG
jgi:hypothetical protein